MAIQLIIALIFVSNIALATNIENKTLSDQKLIHQKIDDSKDTRLMYFWASWCPDCREKLRGPLGDLKKSFKNVEIVTVNLDRNIKRGKHFIEEEKLNLPVIRDENKDLRKKLKIFSVPAWALIKKDGEQWKVIKAANGADLAQIKSAIGEIK